MASLKPLDKIETLDEALYYAQSAIASAATTCPDALGMYNTAQEMAVNFMANPPEDPTMLASFVDQVVTQLRAANEMCDQLKG